MIRVVKPGGLLLFSVPLGPAFREQAIRGVTGAVKRTGRDSLYFFQRIYDPAHFESRLHQPLCGLIDRERARTVDRRPSLLLRAYHQLRGSLPEALTTALGFLNPVMSAAFNRDRPGNRRTRARSLRAGPSLQRYLRRRDLRRPKKTAAMRILLVNPYPPDRPPLSPWPHLGLSLLASRARRAGHEVRVVDYSYSPKAPPVKAWISDFDPHLCGLTLYTAHMKQARKTVWGNPRINLGSPSSSEVPTPRFTPRAWPGSISAIGSSGASATGNSRRNCPGSPGRADNPGGNGQPARPVRYCDSRFRFGLRRRTPAGLSGPAVARLPVRLQLLFGPAPLDANGSLSRHPGLSGRNLRSGPATERTSGKSGSSTTARRTTSTGSRIFFGAIRPAVSACRCGSITSGRTESTRKCSTF